MKKNIQTNKDFAVYILTYGRAHNVITYDLLRRLNYTGKIYLVCSDDDKMLDEYKKKYGDEVIVFNKEDYQGKFDICDNLDDKRVVVYARNAMWDIADRLHIKYFLVLDDDYRCFRYISDKKGNYKCNFVRDLDKIFQIYVDYYKKIPALSICMIQGGDLIGGAMNSMFSDNVMKRKVMNTWFCSTDRKFEIIGRINEDCNTYIYLGTQGKLFLQLPEIRMNQTQTQASEGGLTEFYLDTGTYFKSFYTVMVAPSCARVALMPGVGSRLHHRISWDNCCSKIIREKYKKVA